MKPNFEIVLNYLRLKPGDLTLKLPDGITYGWYDDELCHILFTWKGLALLTDEPDEEKWVKSDVSFNHFIKICEYIPEKDIISLVASIGLQSMKKPRCLPSEKSI